MFKSKKQCYQFCEKKLAFVKLVFVLCIFFLFQKIYPYEKTAFFITPQKWELVNPKLYPPFVKISFVKKEFSTCRPTLNLAIQKTSLTLDEYTKEAKKIHIKDPITTYRILDKIQLSQGPAYICQITKNANSIDFEILQMIFVYDGYAYVLTEACPKEQMINNYQTFIEVFKSFKITDDLFSLVLDVQKRDELIKQFNKIANLIKTSNEKENKKNIFLFEKYLDKKFAKLGKYFQILLIKKIYQN